MDTNNDEKFNVLNSGFCKQNTEEKEVKEEEPYFVMKYTATFSRPIKTSKYFEDVLNNITYIIEGMRLDGYTFYNDKEIFVMVNMLTEDQLLAFDKHILFPHYRDAWKKDIAACWAVKFTHKKEMDN